MNPPSLTPQVRRAPVRVTVIALATAVIAALLVAAPPPALAVTTYDNVDQRPVASFVDAAISISEGAYDPAVVDAVVIATNANFPDALAASALAAEVGGPVLFTAPASLPAPTAAELDRLLDADDTVYLMGGVDAIADAVATELDASYEVVRVQGPTRLETAAAAADLIGVPEGGTVIIARATGPDGAGTPSDRTTGWVDAVSCGAYAARNGIPILLSQTSRLSDTTAGALGRLPAANAIVCGGVSALSAQVTTDLEALDLTVQRIEGPTRVDTAIAAARTLFGFDTAVGHQYTVVNGYGENFGYGLAAAPLGDPILLVGALEPTACDDPNQPSRETLCYLQTATEESPATLLLIGDEGIIRDEVADAVGAAGGGSPGALGEPLAPPTGVTADDDLDDDGTGATVSWTAVADPDEILAGYNVYVGDVRQGSTDPTVGAGTTTFQLSGLRKDAPVQVTVTAVDDEGRETERSGPASVTPEDEVPAAVAAFAAQPGDAKVVLTWTAGPLDFRNYVIGRTAPTSATACPDTGYTTLTTITDRATVTYTDSTTTNGTAYCYQITTSDTAAQTSPPSKAGPATPNVGLPQLTLVYPVGDNAPQTPGAQPDTIHYGPPLTVRYDVTDTDTPAADLRLTLELSYDAGAAGSYERIVTGEPVRFVTSGVQGPATRDIPACAVGDVTSRGCIRDGQDSDVRIRISVADAGNQFQERTSGDLLLSRTPPPVTGLAVTAGQNQVQLTWDRLPAPVTIVPRYRISRAEVLLLSGAGGSNESCPNPASGQYTVLNDRPAQPATGTTVTYVDFAVDSDGPVANPSADYLYCYLVQAERDLMPTVVGPSRLGSANPIVGVGAAVALQSPTQGQRLRIGSAEPIRYTLNLPAGTTVSDVQLFWCRDYRPASGITPAACADTDGGFKEMTPMNGLSAEPPRTNGSHTVNWTVPAAAGQDDNDRGAIELRAQGTNAQPSRVTDLIFR